jgi:lysophospholipase L1-like esterase
MPFRRLRAVPRRTAATVALLTLLVAALVTPGASAHPSDRRGPSSDAGARYLALGDSVPFGFRPGAVTTPAEYADASGFSGYPELLAARTPPLRLTNASCPGETSASMIDLAAQSNGCANSLGSPVGYRDLFPLHTAYDGAQLDYAVDYLRAHRGTQLVSLTIGANDLFLCQRTTADQCAGASFPPLLARVGANTDRILSTLRDEAGYRGRLVLLTYYSLSYTDPAQVAGTQALNSVLARAAQANGATVADGFGAFAAAAGPQGDPCAAGLLIALPSGGCDVHPTAAGHGVLASAVQEVATRSRR